MAGISNGPVSNQTTSTITETLVNTTTSPITVLYLVIPSANGCNSASFTYSVTVNPTPQITSAASTIVCNSKAQNYTITSSVTGSSYTWSRATVPGISNLTVSNQAGNIISESLTNTTSSPVVVTYVIIPAANGCAGPAFEYKVTVNPTPVITNTSMSQTVCSQGSASSVSLQSNVSSVTFAWTATASAEIQGYSSSGTGDIPVQTLVNSGNTQGKITYVITPLYNGCPGIPANYVVFVNPKPATPTIAANSPVCENYTLNLTTPTIAGASYSWTGPNGFVSNVQNPSISNVTSAAAGLYLVRVTVDGCSSDAGTATISVTPTPAKPAIVSNSPVCAGTTLTLSTNTVAGASYSWTGPNGFTSSLQNPQISASTTSASGTYTLTVTVNGCTSPAGTSTLVVNAIPQAPTAGSNSPVCENSNVNLFTNTVSGASYSWTGPNGFTSTAQNPVVANAKVVNAGKYFVTVTVNGCTSATTEVNVDVNSSPINPVLSSSSPVCSSGTIQLTATTFTGAIYRWTGPNGFTSNLQNPEIPNSTLANSGTYTVTINAPGCTVTATKSIVVKVNQTPLAPTAANNSPLCVGTTLNLTAQTVSGASYSWTGPNGFTSSLQNPSISNVGQVNEGEYKVTVTVDNCTSAAASTSVEVNESAIVLAGANQTVCANNSSNIFYSGSISGGTTTGIWSSNGSGTFSPSNTSLSGRYVPSAADMARGSVNLTLTSTNNKACSASTSSFTITITPSPVVDAGADQEICANDEGVMLEGSVAVASGGVWTSDGSGTFVPSNTSLQATYVPSEQDKEKGFVTLKLTSTGNGLCLAVFDEMDVTIIAAPEIEKMGLRYVLEGQRITLNPVVRGQGLQFSWSPNLYLNSSTESNPVVTGVEDQVYTLTVTGASGCVSEEQVMVKVLKPIVIPNTFTPNGDGVNDVWSIKELWKYPGAKVKIFNRYGMEMFRSDGYNEPWDGTYNGKPLPVATYYYIIDINSPIYKKLLSGSITIVR
ncbi:MAG: type sorting protein [Sphingobacteriaceae bacterium]|nr:type sorting protein [Sphingobacteriaceae bacterium]